jgi:hypothetical protein
MAAELGLNVKLIRNVLVYFMILVKYQMQESGFTSALMGMQWAEKIW